MGAKDPITSAWALKPHPFALSSGKKQTTKHPAQNKNYTYGDLFDKSAEASEKRAQKFGKDPIKEKKYAEYSKMTNGKMHPQQMKENFNKIVTLIPFGVPKE